ncbi:alkylation response protein AidB-like acyl-CoA dehydrogenase [Prauserella shujinwangii]|uniref:Alkylation response protein AidB-like acyl-CoA dehydrogenase n=1 Tax=Prauserella shujinwangii TaxID=1453103 RepID=A0A2T0LS13_9PSEU|nr:acyl-CoA dehydrogenase family protein [Prauserella shujinwangii]PRX46460.1 alkylation response protein AidB-like acyl-CoA dehydrogenase [Prauserella shujinwangii]
MDFSPTEAQRDLADLTRRIVTDRVTPETLGPHGSGGFDRALWTELARAGVLDAALPSAVGGGGFGLLEQCSVLIELGRAVAPVPYLPTITMAGAALAEYGSGAQRERWLVPALRGDRVLAVALPDTGTPTGFTAERAGEGWRLSGAQTAVAFGAFADGLLVRATTGNGDVLALVGAEAPGLTITPQRVVDHADAALVEATDVTVGADDVLGTAVADGVRLRGTVGVCALQLGVLERALELTAAHAREREQFGQVIGGFQAVRQRLADAYVDVEAVRLTLWQAAWRLSAGEPAAEEAATAKYWAAQAGHRVAHTAVHVHGGVGIDVEHPLHRYFVAAKRHEFALGGATAQLRHLGGLLA